MCDPEHDDQGSDPMAVAIMTGLAHDGDDLINGRQEGAMSVQPLRVGGVALALVPWAIPVRNPGVVAGDLCESWTITRPPLQPTRCRTTGNEQ
jgi:hypothetical protein